MFGNQQANPKAYSGLFTIVVSFDHFKVDLNAERLLKGIFPDPTLAILLCNHYGPVQFVKEPLLVG